MVLGVLYTITAQIARGNFRVPADECPPPESPGMPKDHPGGLETWAISWAEPILNLREKVNYCFPARPIAPEETQRMAGHRKTPRTEARDAHSPAKRYSEAGKTDAARFRQIAVQLQRI